MGNCMKLCGTCLVDKGNRLIEAGDALEIQYGATKDAAERVDHVPQDVSGAPTGWKGYHGAISNEQAENRLRIKGANKGMFLVYDDPLHQGQYLLAVYYRGEVHRVRILRRSDGKYVLGQDVPGARAHDSIHIALQCDMTTPF